MTGLEHQINEFTQFALSHSSENVTLDDLYDRWRDQNHRDVDASAVEASLRDMDQGKTGRPFDAFANEFRQRNKLGERE